ncbi:hypothetical protein GCM10010116_18130 [Microbispora rosea subsp. aerata]|nr:DUF4245 domain-containing protein [Microbispora rosea]GGO08916.1 hypothetical protein GCM10010116_18130 [Microbispora rosea subsp. aerata]GIH55305.1 hypothetical protein Mro02_22190 [Microbispora rosea subsp. aerata]GLJ86598.1 hypothetical protein GCM10017588_53360 [Microbispora rosea subsp. aerata]
MGRFTQGFYGYAFALLVCLAAIGVFLLITPQSRTEHIPRVDFTIDRANAARTASYEVVAPDQVLPNWVPNSSSLTQKNGAVTWRLGFATAKRQHAMVAQSDEKPSADFVNRMANTDKPGGSRQIDGVTWEERFRQDKNQRSLVRVFPDHAVVVTGTADWDELTALARTLTPQPKPSPAPSSS